MKTAVVATLIISSLFFFPDTQAAEVRGEGKGMINIRVSPNENATIACKVNADKTLQVTDFLMTGVREKTHWCKVAVDPATCNGRTEAWVAGWIVQEVESDLSRFQNFIKQNEQTSQTEGCADCTVQAEGPSSLSAIAQSIESKAHVLDVPVKMEPCNSGIPNRVCNCRVSSNFGYRNHPISGAGRSFHSGIDIAAARGTPVYASADGYVRSIYKTAHGYGNQIILIHSDDVSKDEVKEFASQTVRMRVCGLNKVVESQGLRTRYNHLHRFRPDLKKGDFVKKGDLLGYINSTGESTGDHLHFEVRAASVGTNNFGRLTFLDPRYFSDYMPSSRYDRAFCMREGL